MQVSGTSCQMKEIHRVMTKTKKITIEEMWEQQREFMELLKKERGFAEFPVDISSKKGQQFLEGIAFHMMRELFEAFAHLRNKSHRVTEDGHVDMQAYTEELSDVFHLFIEICIASGITCEDFTKMYFDKGEKNSVRIASGY